MKLGDVKSIRAAVWVTHACQYPATLGQEHSTLWKALAPRESKIIRAIASCSPTIWERLNEVIPAESGDESKEEPKWTRGGEGSKRWAKTEDCACPWSGTHHALRANPYLRVDYFVGRELDFTNNIF